MPIYAYRCDACAFRKDVLQKMSDPALTECPSCGADAFKKQLSAPAFQLKGTGWYATDFRDNGKKKPEGEKAEGADAEKAVAAPEANGSTPAAAEGGTADKKSNGKPESSPAKGEGAGGPAPAVPPAKPASKDAGSGGSATTPGGSGAS